jgi:hypothetical protein
MLVVAVAVRMMPRQIRGLEEVAVAVLEELVLLQKHIVVLPILVAGVVALAILVVPDRKVATAVQA